MKKTFVRQHGKSEREAKHVSSGAAPTSEFDDDDPGMQGAESPPALSKKDDAAPNGDRRLLVSKTIYVVHGGVVYKARRIDQGNNYHGHPYRGKLSVDIIEKLVRMADKKGCADAFAEWVKKHIEVIGHPPGTSLDEIRVRLKAMQK